MSNDTYMHHDIVCSFNNGGSSILSLIYYYIENCSQRQQGIWVFLQAGIYSNVYGKYMVTKISGNERCYFLSEIVAS